MNKSEKPSYLKIFFRSLGLIFKSAPTKVTFLMIILALQIFIPVVQATAIAKFIDSVKTLSDVKSAILIMLPFIIAVLIDFLVGPLMMIVQGECTDSLVKKVNMDLFNKVSEVDNLNTLDNRIQTDKFDCIFIFYHKNIRYNRGYVCSALGLFHLDSARICGGYFPSKLYRLQTPSGSL